MNKTREEIEKAAPDCDTTETAKVKQGNALDANIIPKTLIRLVDDLGKPMRKLEHADLLLSEIMENYFFKYDSSEKDGRVSITWEYTHNGIKADIAHDAVSEALEDLKNIRALCIAIEAKS